MREKLIELLREGRTNAETICYNNDDCQNCPITDLDGNCKYGYIADHLIANGVTVPTGEIEFDYNAEDV